MDFVHKLAGREWRLATTVAVVLFAASFDFSAQAKGPMEGFATDPNAPVEIESDRLDVNDQEQTAIFTGNVVTKQGATIMRSDSLKAVYARRSAAPAPTPAANDADAEAPAAATSNPLSTGRTQITDIYAYGNVHVTSKDDQSADGQWAHYIVANRNIEMGDAVVLRQKANVIRGSKLHIDLNSGKSQIVSAASKSGGRVKGLFQTPEGKKAP
jgi:lipopolysaccharide export system protein LptA